jgi:lipopolysaccharide/colanic/teichoic acid biosynthesis glycosyltransferase
MRVTNDVKNASLAARLSSLGGHSAHTLVQADRVSDIMQYGFAAIGLVLMAPLFLVISLLIKFTSQGPVLYRGLRVGKDGRIFTIYKFRTLQVGAEEKIGARLLTDRDTFFTPVGKFLKCTKFDELPQLVNVLQGEMNLVGPRPIRPIFVEKLCGDIPRYPIRFAVKPGMTGLAQIRGGYFTDPRDKLRYELLYIKNRSPLLDLKLIALTLAGIPKDFSSGPFSVRRPLPPGSPLTNAPTSSRAGKLVSGETPKRPRDGRWHLAVAWPSLSAERSSPETLAVIVLRQMLECALPLVKPERTDFFLRESSLSSAGGSVSSEVF